MTVSNPTPLPLLDEEDAFTAQTESALLQIFSRFALKHPKRLSPSELAAFVQAANHKPFTAEELSEMKIYFEMDEDSLTERGFLEMYQIQSLADEDETRRDLVALGFTEFSSNP